jgi:hypothetical protein
MNPDLSKLNSWVPVVLYNNERHSHLMGNARVAILTHAPTKMSLIRSLHEGWDTRVIKLVLSQYSLTV